MTRLNLDYPDLPSSPRAWQPATRRERFLHWLDQQHELGRLIEWTIVLVVILGLVAFIAAVSRLDGDLDVAAKVANDADARARALVCAEAK